MLLKVQKSRSLPLARPLASLPTLATLPSHTATPLQHAAGTAPLLTATANRPNPAATPAATHRIPGPAATSSPPPCPGSSAAPQRQLPLLATPIAMAAVGALSLLQPVAKPPPLAWLQGSSTSCRPWPTMASGRHVLCVSAHDPSAFYRTAMAHARHARHCGCTASDGASPSTKYVASGTSRQRAAALQSPTFRRLLAS